MPLDMASALVSFIGLSGQVLQGCNYLCDFFADAKDAPAIIKNISDHLEVIQPALSTIRVTFWDLQAISHSLPILQDPTPVLKNCESAIAELKAFVDRQAAFACQLQRRCKLLLLRLIRFLEALPVPKPYLFQQRLFPEHQHCGEDGSG
jgi:hypothetical protein